MQFVSFLITLKVNNWLTFVVLYLQYAYPANALMQNNWHFAIHVPGFQGGKDFHYYNIFTFFFSYFNMKNVFIAVDYPRVDMDYRKGAF